MAISILATKRNERKKPKRKKNTSWHLFYNPRLLATVKTIKKKENKEGNSSGEEEIVVQQEHA